MAKTLLSGSCIVCSQKSPTKCSRCKLVFYCGVECQRKDRPRHKAECIGDIEETIAFWRRNARPCSCAECSHLCTEQPGAFDPTHLFKLAQKDPSIYANVVQDKVFINKELDPIFYLRPKKITERGGERCAMMPSPAPCSFLGPQGCMLARDDMPIGCVVVLSCEQFVIQADKDQASVVWTTPIARKVMQEFEAFNRKRGSIYLGNDDTYGALVKDILHVCETQDRNNAPLNLPLRFYQQPLPLTYSVTEV